MKTIKLETDLRPRAFVARRFWSPEAIVGTLQEFIPISSRAFRKVSEFGLDGELARAALGRGKVVPHKITWGRPDHRLPWAPSATAEILRDFRTTRKRPGAEARIAWLVGTWGLGSVIAMVAKEAKGRGWWKTYQKLEDALDANIGEEIAREEAEDA